MVINATISPRGDLPDMWLAEHVGRSAHEAAAKARRAEVKTRKVLQQPNAVQLSLA